MPTIKKVYPDEVRTFMDSNAPESYVLLDVRQSTEYEREHLPGAQLIPLTELPDRMDDVEPGKPVVVYCASGGRSTAASSLLEGTGRGEIMNMIGGIGAWMGQTAFGPMDLDVLHFTGNESAAEVLLKAYAMEENLQRFYVQRADMAETPERIELFMELAGFEDRHKQTLANLYERVTGEQLVAKAADEAAGDDVEGGIEINDFLTRYPQAFDSDQGVLDLAAVVEAQALDYYQRCAAVAEKEETVDVLNTLAREEKAHLKLIGKFMDRN